MALSRLNYNSLNVTPTASKGIGFDAGADDLAATFSGGAMTFIKKLTASTSATLSFVDGTSDVVLDDTYKEYMFTFKDIHPGSHDADFTFQVSIDSGSNYNVAMTTTVVSPFHYENDSSTALYYNAPKDQAQGTAFQSISSQVGSDADQSVSGSLRLFNPASTTFVKHFICNAQTACLDGSDDPYSMQDLSAGYANTTSAVDAVQFKMSTGNIDAGDICLYGIK